MAIRTGSQRPARYRGRSLGLPAGTTLELVRHILRGFSFQTLLSLEAKSGLGLIALAQTIGIPERTLARRKTSGRLAPDESERLLRISTVFEKAVELFEGDVASAVRWLRSPKVALAGETPLAFARTEIGAREVEMLIGRLEHGVYS